MFLSQQEQQEGHEDCAICQESLQDSASLILACKHSFHSMCSLKWYKSKSPCTCPLCRAPFNITQHFSATGAKVAEPKVWIETKEEVRNRPPEIEFVLNYADSHLHSPLSQVVGQFLQMVRSQTELPVFMQPSFFGDHVGLLRNTMLQHLLLQQEILEQRQLQQRRPPPREMHRQDVPFPSGDELEFNRMFETSPPHRSRTAAPAPATRAASPPPLRRVLAMRRRTEQPVRPPPEVIVIDDSDDDAPPAPGLRAPRSAAKPDQAPSTAATQDDPIELLSSDEEPRRKQPTSRH